MTDQKNNVIVTPRLSSDLTVKELLDRHPQLLQTFIELGLLCVGCPTDKFHTLADVAREYGFDQNQLLHCLENAIEYSRVTDEPRR